MRSLCGQIRNSFSALDAPARIFVRAAGAFCVTSLLAAVPAFAQEGASATESPVGRTFRWLNFIVVLVIFGGVIAKFGGPAFRNRAAAISEKIAEGARAREAAEQQRQGKAVTISYQQLAESIGISKSSAQAAAGWLARRKLITVSKAGFTSTPSYSVQRPWLPR